MFSLILFITLILKLTVLQIYRLILYSSISPWTCCGEWGLKEAYWTLPSLLHDLWLYTTPLASPPVSRWFPAALQLQLSQHINELSEAHFDFTQTFLPMKPCIFRWVLKIYSCSMRSWFFYGHGFSLKLGHSLPCVSMSIRNVPKSLNWTGGISECRNFNTTSATPANSILDLFTTGKKKKTRQIKTLFWQTKQNIFLQIMFIKRWS